MPHETQWYHWAQGIAAIVSILMALVFVPFIRLVNKIRTNDLHHLDLKLDANHNEMLAQVELVSGQVEDVKARVDKVEGKLDRHIEAHAEGRYQQ